MYLFILCLKQHLPCQCIQKSSFLEQIIGNSPEINHFELESDLDPEPEKLCEHGTRWSTLDLVFECDKIPKETPVLCHLLREIKIFPVNQCLNLSRNILACKASVQDY